MRNELNNLVATLRETASHIEDRLKATDPNINLDISTPTPETLASEIRGQVFKVFRLTANLLGRS